MASLIPPVDPRRRTADVLSSAAVLVAIAVLGYAATIVMGVLLFAANPEGGAARTWAMLLTWQLPLALWIAAAIAVVVLAVQRRRTLRVSLIGASVIAVSITAGLVVAAG
ncbi:hypothetical protein [Agrococcus jenensis]|uniref:Uncharacterized protein n=1 Tax=Agrococcus jenensis TaxID=46353 RepID=A0A3N2AQX6_9MICO|nr:hypothetical protein [Agrococcus jenensis]ROR65305.1 hypothetical protein EDD26_0671 [Agrococcus jenensis]